MDPLITLQTAAAIVDATLQAGRRGGLQPLAVVVLDAGGHDVALKREDGCAFLRARIARGKAWGALGMGLDSRALGSRAEQNPRFFAALAALADGQVIPNAGGVLIRNAAGRLFGAVGVSGDQAERDESVARDALRALGLLPEVDAAPP